MASTVRSYVPYGPDVHVQGTRQVARVEGRDSRGEWAYWTARGLHCLGGWEGLHNVGEVASISDGRCSGTEGRLDLLLTARLPILWQGHTGPQEHVRVLVRQPERDLSRRPCFLLPRGPPCIFCLHEVTASCDVQARRWSIWYTGSSQRNACLFTHRRYPAKAKICSARAGDDHVGTGHLCCCEAS